MEKALNQIYQRLEGKHFQATNKGEFEVATGNMRTALEIKDQDMEKCLAKIISEVSDSDQLDYNKVWRAITGPKDGYDKYWLWVSLDEDDLDLKSYRVYDFRVTEVEPFSKLNWRNPYEAGVSISVTVEE